MATTLKTQIFSTINDVPQALWDGVLGRHSQTFSHAFWQTIENSVLNDFSYRYALFFDDRDAPVGLASFYAVTTDIAIFAPLWLRRALQTARRFWPNFLKLRMLECGTPITLNSPPFIACNAAHRSVIAETLDALLTETARREKQLLIVIRDFEPGTEALQSDFAGRDYCLVESLPNTYMDIQWPTAEAYAQAMKSYFRCKLGRHLRKAEQQHLRHELVNDFAPLADLLCEQWLNVHHNATEFQREMLTPAFYRAFSQNLGSASKAILFYQQDELVGHVLLHLDGDLLRWLYFGRKDSVKDFLYLYAGQKVVETAIALSAKRLELGLTTYAIKQDLGAQVTPIRLAIKSPWRIINPLVKRIYPLMNKIPVIENKDVFKR